MLQSVSVDRCASIVFSSVNFEATEGEPGVRAVNGANVELLDCRVTGVDGAGTGILADHLSRLFAQGGGIHGVAPERGIVASHGTVVQLLDVLNECGRSAVGAGISDLTSRSHDVP